MISPKLNLRIALQLFSSSNILPVLVTLPECDGRVSTVRDENLLADLVAQTEGKIHFNVYWVNGSVIMNIQVDNHKMSAWVWFCFVRYTVQCVVIVKLNIQRGCKGRIVFSSWLITCFWTKTISNEGKFLLRFVTTPKLRSLHHEQMDDLLLNEWWQKIQN